MRVKKSIKLTFTFGILFGPSYFSFNWTLLSNKPADKTFLHVTYLSYKNQVVQSKSFKYISM